ncbi:MAG TPA: nitrilase-related carbon-nitrogen hydrolase [Ktedonobacteraceae bacterium]|nr:nitrilase-related carbon-nitrogen hydrolase [Ktedonobacteraceae bacterium]
MTLSASSGASITRYRVAAIQFNPLLGEKARNMERLLRLVEEAARQDARLIVLPEMATTGYCWVSREEIAPYMEPIPGPTTELFQELAARYNCYIALGLPELDTTSGIYYNSMALIGPAGLVGSYRKIHSYIAEPRWARDGDQGFPIWETPLGRLAGAICMDAMYFESTRLSALQGADIILFPTNWLEDHCPSSWWMARALENGVYIIAANRSDVERGAEFSGGSCILDPDGTIQAYLDAGEGIVYGEIDLERARSKVWGQPEALGNRLADRRPECYIPLAQNTYLWEPLHYHGLYELGALPPGQLSCVGIIQTALHTLTAVPEPAMTLSSLHDMLRTLLHDHEPTRPDVLVLPELLLPGPLASTTSEAVARMQAGALCVPGPETATLVELATEFQITLVLGVAERVETPHAPPTFYNTVLLIDPEGIYGIYRKLHLTQSDRLWASPGDCGLPTFDIPAGRIGLATGYDVLFPETLRVLAGAGTDLVCAPTCLNFPAPLGLPPSRIRFSQPVAPYEFDPTHSLIWRVRAAEHHVYLALANWSGQIQNLNANGYSGIFSPSTETYPWREVVVEEDDEPGLTMMTIDTREQRTGRRSTTYLNYAPGELSGSLTGELAYNIRDSIPGNVVRSKPLLRKRQPFWYLDLVKNVHYPQTDRL